ncbi:MAG: J domain-containing protein [Anaerolineae bacterium]|nr:J domain-containing protein [Anaerolineae bacterium]
MKNAFRGEFRDYYALLGLSSEGASSKEVRAAYRRQTRMYHPDVNPTEQDDSLAYAEANERMCRINEAYYVLHDPERRAAYDAQRLAWLQAVYSAQSVSREQKAYPGFKPRYTPYDLDVPNWIERLYGIRLDLQARLKPILPWLDLFAPIIGLCILFVIGFLLSGRIADDPVIRALGINSVDVLVVLIGLSIFWFVPFWFLLKFKR